MQDWWYW